VVESPVIFGSATHGPATTPTVQWNFSGTIPNGAGSVPPAAIIIRFAGAGVKFHEQMVIGWKIDNIMWDNTQTSVLNSTPSVRIAEERDGANKGLAP
jgi:hypothetical protein